MEKKEISIGPRVDAERLVQEVGELTRKLIDRNSSQNITCIGISSLLGWVALGEDGRPVEDAWTWMHQETQQFGNLVKNVPNDFYERTGRRFNSELPALKFKALKESQPKLYQRVLAFISIKDYLIYRLTGSVVTDYVHASYTGFFSIATFGWDLQLLRWFGVDVDKLPSLHYSSEIAGTTGIGFATESGMPPGIPVVVGGPDGSMAVLGGGGVKPGDLVNVMGTTDVCFGVTEKPHFDKERSLLNNPHLLPNLWLTGGPMGMTGGTVRWFVNELGNDSGVDNSETMLIFETLAERIPAGSSNLFFIPSLTGERTPFWNPSIRGSIVGLSKHHTKGHIYRALLEGNGFSLNHLFQKLESSGCEFKQYIALGGGARSRLALQIRADITGKRICVPKEIEASTLGIAILCSIALGHCKDAQDAARRLIEIDFYIEPDMVNRALYQVKFEKYLQLLQTLATFYGEQN